MLSDLLRALRQSSTADNRFIGWMHDITGSGTCPIHTATDGCLQRATRHPNVPSRPSGSSCGCGIPSPRNSASPRSGLTASDSDQPGGPSATRRSGRVCGQWAGHHVRPWPRGSLPAAPAAVEDNRVVLPCCPTGKCAGCRPRAVSRRTAPRGDQGTAYAAAVRGRDRRQHPVLRHQRRHRASGLPRRGGGGPGAG